MVEGEPVNKRIISTTDIRYEIKREDVSINIVWSPISTSARGHRSHYSFVDKDIICMNGGYDKFILNIYTRTIDYNVKDEYKNEFEQRLFLF